MTIDVGALFTAISQSTLYRLALEFAAAAGLPVTSWRTGDPTPTTLAFTAEQIAQRDLIAAEFGKSAFLSTAEGDWKTVVAAETYGVEREEAGYAAPTVTVTNSGGGYYPREIGDLIFKASSINKTYHTTSAGVISAGSTVTFNLVADEAGSNSSVSANEIDEMVTPLIGVSIVSSTAATALDAQSDDSLEDQCNDTLGALSPNGPDDAYEYVVKNSELTGSTEITRARSSGDSDTGDVVVYVAGPAGTVSAGALTAAQDAVEAWATPLCITPTVVNSTAVPINFEATITGEDIPLDAEDLIEIALLALLAEPEAQGGTVAFSKIEQVIHNAVPEIVSVNLISPSADTVLALSEVATMGTLDISEV